MLLIQQATSAAVDLGKGRSGSGVKPDGSRKLPQDMLAALTVA